jgi:hypothetical protein
MSIKSRKKTGELVHHRSRWAGHDEQRHIEADDPPTKK